MFLFFKKLYYSWKLRNYDKTTKFYTLNKFNIWAKIVHVYDGDTVHAVFIHPDSSKIYKYKLRLAHIDTPELNSKNPNEVKKANEAKKIVEEMILNKIVFLELEGEDKYGRLLANINIDGLDLNEYLIEKNYAYRYEGGTKKIFGKKEAIKKTIKKNKKL
jgi:micrococcal nuclease